MGTRFQITACPLCADEFDDPAEFKDHLAFMHDLVDDEGAETTLPEEPEPEPVPPAPVVVGLTEPVVPVPFVPPARPALTEPVAVRVDRRVLPGLVAAVVLQLVIALLGLAVVDGDSSPDRLTTAAGSAAGGATTDTSAPAADPVPGAPAAAPATTAPPTTAAPKVDTSGDQARADAFTLRASDLPSGFEEFDPDAGGDEEATEDGPECAAANDPTETESLTGETSSLFGMDVTVVIGGGMVLSSEKDALRTMDVIRELTPCFGDQMLFGAEEEFPEGVTMTHGAFSSLGYPTYGDETIASSMPVTISGPGGQFPLRVDVLAIRVDRAIHFTVVIASPDEFTPQQERGMLSAIALRMAPRAV